jgi:hypothetical protein
MQLFWLPIQVFSQLVDLLEQFGVMLLLNHLRFEDDDVVDCHVRLWREFKHFLLINWVEVKVLNWHRLLGCFLFEQESLSNVVFEYSAVQLLVLDSEAVVITAQGVENAVRIVLSQLNVFVLVEAKYFARNHTKVVEEVDA